MKRTHGLLVACAVLFIRLPVVAADGSYHLSAESLDGGGFVSITADWRYHPGDQLEWARPGFDDSSWELVDTRLVPAGWAGTDWPGVGWFRLHLSIDSTLVDFPLEFSLGRSAGAAEVYLDGALLQRFGRVGSRETEETEWRLRLEPISFSAASGNVVAVRYSNSRASSHARAGFAAGFSFQLGRFIGQIRETFVEDLVMSRTIQTAFSALPFAFGLLHLFLFLFFRGARENLYYAIFLFLTSATTYLDYQHQDLLVTHAEQRLLYLRLHRCEHRAGEPAL